MEIYSLKHCYQNARLILILKRCWLYITALMFHEAHGLCLKINLLLVSMHVATLEEIVDFRESHTTK